MRVFIVLMGKRRGYLNLLRSREKGNERHTPNREGMHRDGKEGRRDPKEKEGGVLLTQSRQGRKEKIF